jgi:hypothetical protein
LVNVRASGQHERPGRDSEVFAKVAFDVDR